MEDSEVVLDLDKIFSEKEEKPIIVIYRGAKFIMDSVCNSQVGINLCCITEALYDRREESKK